MRPLVISSKSFAGSAITWSAAVRAQRTERVRRIGVFMPYAADVVAEELEPRIETH
jgi:hypothetical protein